MAIERAHLIVTDLSSLKTALPPARSLEAPPEAPEIRESVLLDSQEPAPAPDPQVPFSCTLPYSQHQALDRLKRERGLGKGIVVKEALAAYLKKLGVVAGLLLLASSAALGQSETSVKDNPVKLVASCRLFVQIVDGATNMPLRG
jgi:hypothetical protein